jgi:hypothetical protein
MQIHRFNNKSRYMDKIEKLHIYKGTFINNPLNDKHTVFQNEILEAITATEMSNTHA